MRIFIILLISFLVSSASDIFKTGSYIVDKQHNLIWQDNQDNTFMLGSQEEAIEYCEQLTLGGYTNWELPTKEQYEYIIDKTRNDEIMINQAFQNIINESYWTSSRTWQSFGRYGYYFFIKSGTLYYENRSYPKFFRCIRENE